MADLIRDVFPPLCLQPPEPSRVCGGAVGGAAGGGAAAAVHREDPLHPGHRHAGRLQQQREDAFGFSPCLLQEELPAPCLRTAPAPPRAVWPPVGSGP